MSNITINNSCSYFDLVPHDKNTLLPEPKLKYKQLCLFEFIINSTIDALEAFYINKQYGLFDPHVGDTLCQIRAAELLYLSQHVNFSITETLSSLKTVLMKTKLLIPIINKSISIKRSPQERYQESNQTLREFLSKHKLDVTIPKELDFITKSYLLTQYKFHPLGVIPRVNYIGLCIAANVSKDLSLRLIRYWQKSLAVYSCTYIKTISKVDDILFNILKINDDENRELLPSFFVMQHLLEFLKSNSTTILFIIRHPLDKTIAPIVMTWNVVNNKFSLTKKIALDKPCFTVHCISTALSSTNSLNRIKIFLKILHLGVEEILLYSVANHPQYSSTSLFSPTDDIYDAKLNMFTPTSSCYQKLNNLSVSYNQKKSAAKNIGCDHYNPIFIFVEHMLISTQREQMSLFSFGIENFHDIVSDDTIYLGIYDYGLKISKKLQFGKKQGLAEKSYVEQYTETKA